jgi:plasmid stabilization system protein ParE
VARKVKWVEVAWKDFEEVAEYIAKDSPYYAASFVKNARNIARSLSNLADRGRIVPEFNNKNIRELFVGNYRMIYQIKNEVIYVIGFIHGARDLWTLWEREDRNT